MKKIYTALTSVFHQNGLLNKEAMQAIINYNLDIMQVDGLYLNGSTGEFPMLTLTMKKELLAFVWKECQNKNVDLIAQIGSTSIFETIELGEFAKKLGYQKLSCISPFYFKVDFKAYYDYYTKVANTLKVDLYPYYIPALTGTEFTNEEIHQILNIDFVKGIKFSSTNVQKLHEVRKENLDKTIFWGWDEMMIDGLLADVDGFIGSTYALNGLNARKLIKAYENSDLAKIQKLTWKNIDIIKKMVNNNLFETIKYFILHYYDIPYQGSNILPTQKLDENQRKNALLLFQG